MGQLPRRQPRHVAPGASVAVAGGVPFSLPGLLTLKDLMQDPVLKADALSAERRGPSSAEAFASQALNIEF